MLPVSAAAAPDPAEALRAHTVHEALTGALDEAEDAVEPRRILERTSGTGEVGGRRVEHIGDAEAVVHVNVRVDEQHDRARLIRPR